ncbi:MAG: hypothetical protein RL318_7 [Fibrobacterota bacterium]|jgi:ubiquinone/menaquinone biosynthesis C-methylase UbiE
MIPKALSFELDTSALAESYDIVSAPLQFKYGKQLCSELGITVGESVLDVGTGTGLLAEHMASLVGPNGMVTGIDPLPLRIQLAREKIRQRPQLSFQVGKAHDLSAFPDESFDVVCLNDVWQWLADHQHAMQEIHRVLKPNGRFGCQSTFQAVDDAFLRQAPFVDWYPFSQATIGSFLKFEQVFPATNFLHGRVDATTLEHLFSDPDAVIRFFEASSFNNYLGHLPEPLRHLAKRHLVANLEKHRVPEGILLRGTRIIATARKPPRGALYSGNWWDAPFNRTLSTSAAYWKTWRPLKT